MVICFLSSLVKKLRIFLVSVSILLLIGLASPSFADTTDWKFLSGLDMQLFYGFENVLQFEDTFSFSEDPVYDSGNGYGILVFGIYNITGLSFEHYEFNYSEANNPFREFREINVSWTLIGYRHYPFSGPDRIGFYIGASIGLADARFSTDRFVLAGGSSFPIVFTFGYLYKFPFGVTLSVHLMHSASEDYGDGDGDENEDENEVDEERQESTQPDTLMDINDLTLTMFGIAVGYRF